MANKIFYKFPSIEQFNNAVKSLKIYQKYVNHTNGETQDNVLSVKFTGTIKLHGSNAGVVLNFDSETDFTYYPQSRSRVISIESDNLDFSQFAYNPKVRDFLTNFMYEEVYKAFSEEERKSILSVAVYGEWAGVGIQKGVAISEMERFFAPFEVAVYKKPSEEYLKLHQAENVEHQRFFLPLEVQEELLNEELRIFPISKIVKPYEITIELDEKGFYKASETLSDITNMVEKEDPFGKAFGISGVGEGVVWKMAEPNFDFGEIRFKVKGEKHAVSKVKTIAPVDFEKLAKVQEAVDLYATENRFEQGVQYLQEMQIPMDSKSIGEFIKWVQSDIIKEHSEAMLSSGINVKSVTNLVAKKAAEWYKAYINKLTFSE